MCIRDSCKETTLPASIDTLAFHLALILTVCGVSYLILNLLTKSGIPVLKDISVWAVSYTHLDVYKRQK